MRCAPVLVAVGFAVLAACGPGAVRDVCNSAEDCRLRQACIDGLCVDRGDDDSEDAGARADDDGGVVPLDAGPANEDAGALDGGADVDGGAAVDGGAMVDGGAIVDGGPLPVDAGAPDAGHVDVDAGARDGGPLLVDAGPWFDDAYSARAAIRVDASVAKSDATGAVVLVRVPARHLELTSPASVAFVADDHATALAWERSSADSEATHLYWVRLGDVAPGDADHRLWLYSGGGAETAPLDPWADASLVMHFEKPALLEDDSPRAHAAIAVGVPAFDDGFAGGALSLPGVDTVGGLSIPDHDTLDRAASFSVSALVRLDVEPVTFRNVMLKGDAPDYDWAIEGTDELAGRWQLSVRSDADANLFARSGERGLLGARDVHIAAVRRPDGETRVFVDGVLSGTTGVNALLRNTAGPLRIGHVNGFDEQWQGLLDEITVAQVARSDAWIALHARSLLGFGTMLQQQVVVDDAFDDDDPATGAAVGGLVVRELGSTLTESGGEVRIERTSPVAFAWGGLESIDAFDPAPGEGLVAQWTIGGLVVDASRDGSDLVWEGWVRPEGPVEEAGIWANDDGGVFLRIYLGNGDVPFGVVTTATSAKVPQSSMGEGVVDHGVLLFQDGTFATTWDGVEPVQITMRVDDRGWRVAFDRTTRGATHAYAGTWAEDGVTTELAGKLQTGMMLQQYDAATAAMSVTRARAWIDER